MGRENNGILCDKFSILLSFKYFNSTFMILPLLNREW
jgi:hypothetical protein